MKNDKSIGFSGLSVGLFDLSLVFLFFQKNFKFFKNEIDRFFMNRQNQYGLVFLISAKTGQFSLIFQYMLAGS
jgi:hypothetical protein